ncbi:galactokinase [Colwellia chukchiensis]|uniref:Galactokinase n=1 Tax=Colwellia chukchiensis TaxID=641665 RepID=A0A1H7SJJ4_9GAMM|nr:galactokinase [Colwellia chukchiensis]SEL72772.1 galactokinase [Colwellia chukchiensis]
MNQHEVVTQVFKQQFNYPAEIICHAPGRVNIIGDHTDYNDGFVLPAAINFGTTIAAAKRSDNVIRVFAQDCQQELNEFRLDEIRFDEKQMWSNYVRGTLKVLQKTYPSINGADIAVSGNVPQGAGLSSSASFEIAILKTFTELYQLDLDGLLAAKMGQQAENEFVGCNCGIMDQLISAMGKQDHAMLLDCRDLRFEDALIPDGLSLFIVNSNVKRGLVDSAYNLRREQCEQVAAYFNKPALRDVSLAALKAAQDKIDPVLYKRAHHVVSENERTVLALTALKEQDMKLISELMYSSHCSLRDDFEVTTPEMDGLVDMIANEIGQQGGVRMTGGGFGGCVVALVPHTMVAHLTAIVTKNYPKQYGLKPTIYTCVASQGAFR